MSVTNTNDISYTTVAHAYFQVTVTGAAQTLAALIGTSIPPWATMAYITPETGAVRYRADGTAPTAAVGQPVPQGQTWPLVGQPTLAAVKLIAQSGTPILSVEFRG